MSVLHTWEFDGTMDDVRNAVQRVLAEYPGVTLEEDEFDEEPDETGMSLVLIVPAKEAAAILDRTSLRYGDPEPFVVELDIEVDEQGGSMTAMQVDEIDLELIEAFAQKLGARYVDMM